MGSGSAHVSAMKRYIQIYCTLAVLTLIESKGSYSATSNNMKLAHWPLIGGHLVQRGGDWTWP